MDGILDIKLVDELLFGPEDTNRYTQDTPILPEVWSHFAKEPASAFDLLITPYGAVPPAEVAHSLFYWVETHRNAKRQSSDKRHKVDIAYIREVVAARLYFDEIVHFILPDTLWWPRLRRLPPGEYRALVPHYAAYVAANLYDTANRGRRREAEEKPWRPRDDRSDSTNVVRMLVLVATIWWLMSAKEGDLRARPRRKTVDGITAGIQRLARSVYDEARAPRDPRIAMIAFPGDRSAVLTVAPVARAESSPSAIRSDRASAAGAAGKRPRDPFEELPQYDPARVIRERLMRREPRIYLVASNRPLRAAVARSTLATKADAARSLFGVDTSAIRWAIVDSGIDAGHPAFALNGNPTQSRVVATYDFRNLRTLLSTQFLGDTEGRDELAKQITDETNMSEEDARSRLVHLATHAAEARPRDWALVEPLLQRVPRHARDPEAGHGTHVAGILGADWARNGPAAPMRGMCPDIRLYDFRVLGATAADTELNVIAALDFIRYLNERNNFILIHGVNLSVSIPHNVRNYACGRTPVCEASERLVDSGVVVVAAAGNHGHKYFLTTDGEYSGYSASSITDPGNADGVITVGATHRDRPHSYGVSFFSSRGPTADGRIKPDLVAPGEKVRGPLPGATEGELSGTSMAAPHVSGAAAMLLARYPELIGNPRRVKRILCETATDLGRERYFQGHGMLDVLRAMQSI